MSNYRFPWYWQRWRKSWLLRSMDCNVGAVYWWRRRMAAQVLPMCQVLVTCSNDLGKRGWQHRWIAFLVVLLEYRVTFLGWKPKVQSSLVPSNRVVEGIILWTRMFLRVKTQVLRSGDDNACTLFPSYIHHFWRTPFVVQVLSLVVVRVLLLRVFITATGLCFLFLLFLFFLVVCIFNTHSV
jgi:hypothetical protein